MMDLNSTPFPDRLRLANVVLLPPIVRFGEMTLVCISFHVIKFTGGMRAEEFCYIPSPVMFFSRAIGIRLHRSNI